MANIFFFEIANIPSCIQRTFSERLSGVDLGHVGARGGFVLSVGPTSSQHDGKGDDSGIVSPSAFIFGDIEDIFDDNLVT